MTEAETQASIPEVPRSLNTAGEPRCRRDWRGR